MAKNKAVEDIKNHGIKIPQGAGMFMYLKDEDDYISMADDFGRMFSVSKKDAPRFIETLQLLSQLK